MTRGENFLGKKNILESSSRTEATLPDFGGDWRLLENKKRASNSEIEARFYYEFARESQAVLSLTEKLCHFTRRETMAAAMWGLSYPGEPLLHLHPRCASIANALMPRINLREISWNQLELDQQRNLISAFSPFPAFDPLPADMLIEFAQELVDPTKPKSGGLRPRWYGTSRLFWNGIEEIGILINWSQGPQRVKAAIDKWFMRHKRELVRLKSERKLPIDGLYFCLPDKTGAKNPRKKYVAALRGLGAMRLLSSHSLTEAIEISRGSGRKGGSLFYGKFDAKRPTGHGAWKKGIDNALKTFQELFYPQDDYSLHLRRSDGLPDLEEPISYQRYCKRG